MSYDIREPVLREFDFNGMVVRRMPDDLLAIRISLSEVLRSPWESPLLPAGQRAYCIYRGDISTSLALLERAADALRHEIAFQQEMAKVSGEPEQGHDP